MLAPLIVEPPGLIMLMLIKTLRTASNFLIYVFIVLLMVLLGRESRAAQVDVRLWVLVSPAVFLLGRSLLQGASFSKVPFVFVPLLCFWFFEAVRGLLPWMGFQPEPGFAAHYRDSFFLTTQYVLIFSVFFVFCQQKKRALHAVELLGHTSYILAMIAIIPLLLSPSHEPLYDMAQWRTECFWPIRIPWKWIHDYFLPPFAHVNILGDILAIGFFTSSGLILYSLNLGLGRPEKFEERRGDFQRNLTNLIFKVTQSAVILGAILLLYSRGTILTLFLSILVFLFFLYLRFKRNGYIGLIFVVLLGCFFAAAWIGNGSKAVKEAVTAFQETGEEGSSVANKRGAEIALNVYRAYPVWGTGLRGYPQLSQKFDAYWKEGDSAEAYHKTPLNHYLLMLSEAGAGAFLWFAFVLFWLVQTGYRIVVTQSRLKFALGLACLCAVLTILTHSAIGFLMQYFATSALVYALMGMASGILSASFKHEE